MSVKNSFTIVSLSVGGLALVVLVFLNGLEETFKQILVWIAALGFVLPLLKRFLRGEF